MRMVGYALIVITLMIVLAYIIFGVGNTHIIRLAKVVLVVTVIFMIASRKTRKRTP